METPKNFHARAVTWSNYKKHNTTKFLFASSYILCRWVGIIEHVKHELLGISSSIGDRSAVFHRLHRQLFTRDRSSLQWNFVSTVASLKSLTKHTFHAQGTSVHAVFVHPPWTAASILKRDPMWERVSPSLQRID